MLTNTDHIPLNSVIMAVLIITCVARHDRNAIFYPSLCGILMLLASSADYSQPFYHLFHLMLHATLLPLKIILLLTMFYFRHIMYAMCLGKFLSKFLLDTTVSISNSTAVKLYSY